MLAQSLYMLTRERYMLAVSFYIFLRGIANFPTWQQGAKPEKAWYLRNSLANQRARTRDRPGPPRD